MHHLVIPTRSGLFVVVGTSGEAEDTIEVTVLTLMLIIQRKKKAKEEKGLENRKVLLHVKEKQN